MKNAIFFAALAVALASLRLAGDQAKAGTIDCVTIGRPSPKSVYTYRHEESNGKSVENTQQWESVTEKGFRLRATGSKGVEIVVNEHRIVDDVAVLDKTSKLTSMGLVLEATKFSRPGLVMDPFGRACAGRSWKVDSVSASYSSREASHSVSTPTGQLRIVSIGERVTTPAGTFPTVRYIRTSQSTDEYWKSTEHGVIVKHIGRLPGFTVTETLVAIR